MSEGTSKQTVAGGNTISYDSTTGFTFDTATSSSTKAFNISNDGTLVSTTDLAGQETAGYIWGENVSGGYAQTASSSTPINLLDNSAGWQFITGSVAQTINLPNCFTLPINPNTTSPQPSGWEVRIVNTSSAAITLNTFSGTNFVVSIPSGQWCIVVCVTDSVTNAASQWETILAEITPGTGSSFTATTQTIIQPTIYAQTGTFTFPQMYTWTQGDQYTGSGGHVAIVTSPTGSGTSANFEYNLTPVTPLTLTASANGLAIIATDSPTLSFTIASSSTTPQFDLTYTGMPLPILEGGTARSALPTTAVNSSYAAWDSNANMFMNNTNITAFQYASSGLPLQMNIASPGQLLITGNTAGTIYLPDATASAYNQNGLLSTYQGDRFKIYNNTTSATITLDTFNGTSSQTTLSSETGTTVFVENLSGTISTDGFNASIAGGFSPNTQARPPVNTIITDTTGLDAVRLRLSDPHVVGSGFLTNVYYYSTNATSYYNFVVVTSNATWSVGNIFSVTGGDGSTYTTVNSNTSESLNSQPLYLQATLTSGAGAALANGSLTSSGFGPTTTLAYTSVAIGTNPHALVPASYYGGTSLDLALPVIPSGYWTTISVNPAYARYQQMMQANITLNASSTWAIGDTWTSTSATFIALNAGTSSTALQASMSSSASTSGAPLIYTFPLPWYNAQQIFQLNTNAGTVAPGQTWIQGGLTYTYIGTATALGGANFFWCTISGPPPASSGTIAPGTGTATVTLTVNSTTATALYLAQVTSATAFSANLGEAYYSTGTNNFYVASAAYSSVTIATFWTNNSTVLASAATLTKTFGSGTTTITNSLASLSATYLPFVSGADYQIGASSGTTNGADYLYDTANALYGILDPPASGYIYQTTGTAGLASAYQYGYFTANTQALTQTVGTGGAVTIKNYASTIQPSLTLTSANQPNQIFAGPASAAPAPANYNSTVILPVPSTVTGQTWTITSFLRQMNTNNFQFTITSASFVNGDTYSAPTLSGSTISLTVSSASATSTIVQMVATTTNAGQIVPSPGPITLTKLSGTGPSTLTVSSYVYFSNLAVQYPSGTTITTLQALSGNTSYQQIAYTSNGTSWLNKSFNFTITSNTWSVGNTYTNNGNTYVVTSPSGTGTLVTLTQTTGAAPTTSGTLTITSGQGTNIIFSSVTNLVTLSSSTAVEEYYLGTSFTETTPIPISIGTYSSIANYIAGSLTSPTTLTTLAAGDYVEVLCTGNTSNATSSWKVDVVSPVWGTAGQVLTSNGANMDPSFQTIMSGTNSYLGDGTVLNTTPTGSNPYTFTLHTAPANESLYGPATFAATAAAPTYRYTNATDLSAAWNTANSSTNVLGILNALSTGSGNANWLPAGTAGNVLTSDGTNWTSSAPGSSTALVNSIATSPTFYTDMINFFNGAGSTSGLDFALNSINLMQQAFSIYQDGVSGFEFLLSLLGLLWGAGEAVAGQTGSALSLLSPRFLLYTGTPTAPTTMPDNTGDEPGEDPGDETPVGDSFFFINNTIFILPIYAHGASSTSATGYDASAIVNLNPGESCYLRIIEPENVVSAYDVEFMVRNITNNFITPPTSGIFTSTGVRGQTPQWANITSSNSTITATLTATNTTTAASMNLTAPALTVAANGIFSVTTNTATSVVLSATTVAHNLILGGSSAFAGATAAPTYRYISASDLSAASGNSVTTGVLINNASPGTQATWLAAGTAGNVLYDNGTNWISSPISSRGMWTPDLYQATASTTTFYSQVGNYVLTPSATSGTCWLTGQVSINTYDTTAGFQLELTLPFESTSTYPQYGCVDCIQGGAISSTSAISPVTMQRAYFTIANSSMTAQIQTNFVCYNNNSGVANDTWVFNFTYDTLVE